VKYAVILGFFLLAVSCTQERKPMLPKGLSADSIIPHDEMVRLLADMHVLESVLQYERNHRTGLSAPASVRYQELFSEYRISKKRFTLNLAYYQSMPDEFQKMYGDVVTTLEQRKKEQKLR